MDGTRHGNCLRGCEGFTFPLDESLLDISQEIKMSIYDYSTWLANSE